MIANAPYEQPINILPVGDTRRRNAGRAVRGTLFAAALFEIFTLASKEIPLLYLQTPWANDPYDTTISFAIFFIPTVIGISAIRLFLCKGNEPLPAVRLADLVRGCRLVLLMVIFTLISNWSSVALQANRSQWGSQTSWLVAVMAVLTLVIGKAALDIYMVPKLSIRSGNHAALESDWISDAVTLFHLESSRFGSLHKTFTRVRRNPLKSAFVISFIFGAFIALSQARESGIGSISLLFLFVPTLGMFAFLSMISTYLGLVKSHRHLKAKDQRLVDAMVLASAAVPIALAFRNSLWWMVGSNESGGHLAQLSALLVASAITVFLAVLVFETIAGVHADRNEGSDFPVT